MRPAVELRHLRYFVCVAEEGNIGRAALRLHISQPPLTRQIQQLEDQIGVLLFRRTNRGVELTDAGRVLYDDALDILGMTERALERSAKAAQGLLGRLDVAIFGSGIFGAIPRLMRTFRESHPEVSLFLHNMVKDEQIDALRHRRISLAFNRFMRPIEGLTSEVLLTEPLFVAVPSGHDLAERPTLHMRELSHMPLVLYPTGARPSFIDEVHDLCKRHDFSPLVAQEVGDAVHALTLVATGQSATLVPQSATSLALPGIVYRPLASQESSGVDLCCIYRSQDDSPILQALLHSMRQAARAPGFLDAGGN